jgi:hypothetical protein
VSPPAGELKPSACWGTAWNAVSSAAATFVMSGK